jgi:N-acetylmuramoyl-L-alanine amidase
MNCSAPLLLLLLAPVAAAPARAAALKPGHARISGADYARLQDWAGGRDFSLRWLEREKTLQLSNRWARLRFVTGSRQAQINEVQVWLAFPFLYQDGSAWLSELDLEDTLAPVLSPPPNPPGINIHTICLDPGHGGKDPGNRAGAHEEKDYTLLLAREVRAQLQGAGLRVILTRSTDAFVDLPARSELARERKADLFVSLHFNSTEEARDEVKGVEVYCCTPAGATSTNARGEGDTRRVAGNDRDGRNMLLAYQVQKALVNELSAEDRGVRRARFAVLREATMPAILVEGGFMSHPVEGQRIFDAAYRRRMARAIADGILAYKKLVKG